MQSVDESHKCGAQQAADADFRGPGTPAFSFYFHRAPTIMEGFRGCQQSRPSPSGEHSDSKHHPGRPRVQFGPEPIIRSIESSWEGSSHRSSKEMAEKSYK